MLIILKNKERGKLLNQFSSYYRSKHHCKKFAMLLYPQSSEACDTYKYLYSVVERPTYLKEVLQEEEI